MRHFVALKIHLLTVVASFFSLLATWMVMPQCLKG